MRATLLLAPLLLALALPPAAQADHAATCGGPDGYVVPIVLAAWLRPGCLGAAASLGPTCDTPITIFHGQVLKAHAFASPCGAGVWLP
ncbi:MAG TPA: hypothetical protein VNX21_06670 [Candidatus Thermoplasmatota archaeon]|nr:hypothetical protein [Candidatus Thermoplasmatota archaeon]